ncbi:MAG: NCS2 family permease [Acidimicrobiia bacterium]|nr:NCS2 family permease [Acidimicrobiia bacterium]
MAQTTESRAEGLLESLFKLSERGTTVAIEARAGLATFLVMVYIVFLNPIILEPLGFDPVAVAAATALAAGLLSILMGVYSNYPVAMAVGLGINAAVAFQLVIGAGLTPQGAMGVIVLEGVVVTVLVLAGLREKVMKAVPNSLKLAIAVGIGLFILFIGFVNGGLIQAAQGTPVEFVFPTTASASITLLGLLIAVVLYARNVPGALILTIFITAFLALIFGVNSWPDSFPSPKFDTLWEFDLTNVWDLGVLTALLTIFTFMLTDFFDTMGTATAIVEQAGLTDEEGEIPDIGKLLLADSAGAAVGGLFGVSSNTSYIESSAGVAEGGRTGLTSVVTGLLFLLTIFLSPLAVLVAGPVTAAVLILIGFLMVGFIREIDFTDLEEGFPALLAIILMPLTYSITVGIGAGFVMHTVIKVVKGKISEIPLLMWIVSAAFVVYFMQDLLEEWI